MIIMGILALRTEILNTMKLIGTNDTGPVRGLSMAVSGAMATLMWDFCATLAGGTSTLPWLSRACAAFRGCARRDLNGFRCNCMNYMHSHTAYKPSSLPSLLPHALKKVAVQQPCFRTVMLQAPIVWDVSRGSWQRAFWICCAKQDVQLLICSNQHKKASWHACEALATNPGQNEALGSACVYIHMYTYVYYIYVYIYNLHVYKYMHILCMYVCMHLCMYVYVYIYIMSYVYTY